MTHQECLNADVRIFLKECHDELDDLSAPEKKDNKSGEFQMNEEGTDYVYIPPSSDFRNDPQYKADMKALKGG
jgi:hypothetical protein